MLRVAELRVAYGRLEAVRGVSFEIPKGEALGVVGPNGAGKSSLLRAIAGVVPDSAGAVELCGEAILGQQPEDIVRRGIALVPEGRRILAGLTVAENLMLGATLRRRESATATVLERQLERFPVLRTYLDSPAGRLSGGEQQQLAIARALMARPDVLMLDEPSLGLAPKVTELVFETLAELRDSGVTILLVEQKTAAAIEFADSWLVLRSGQVVLAGANGDQPDPETLAAAYLGRRAGVAS